MLDGGKGGRKCGTTWPKRNLWHEIMGLDFCGVGRSGRSFRINLQARGVLRGDYRRVFGVQKRRCGKMGAGITLPTERELSCINQQTYSWASEPLPQPRSSCQWYRKSLPTGTALTLGLLLADQALTRS